MKNNCEIINQEFKDFIHSKHFLKNFLNNQGSHSLRL